MLPIITTLALLSAQATGSIRIRQASKGFASVDVSKSTGTANTIASGWIYGFPDTGVQYETVIPENLVRDVNFRATRAGGAQIAPRGWVKSIPDYEGRFNSTLSNYRTARHFGGDFIMLVHDLWGADGSGIPSFPGDKGDWTNTDAFLKRLSDDIKSNDMLDGLVLDLWNEPDGTLFWNAPYKQYTEYYVRAHKFFKNALPDTLISGPSMAQSPRTGYSQWNDWLEAVSTNEAIPDRYSWHQIGVWSREPDTTLPDFNTIKAVYKMPDRPIDINEYAWPSEQNPANAVFYIAQLERHNMRGLRANWGGGSALHDFEANLIRKSPSGSYFPNGEWQLYKYYAQMTGDRVATNASSDHTFDVFATKSNCTIKIIAGTRTIKAPYEIHVSGLQSLGVSSGGSIPAQVYRFDWAGAEKEINAPVDMGRTTFQFSSDVLSIPVNPPTNSTAYAYELSVCSK